MPTRRRRRNQGIWFPTIGTATRNEGFSSSSGREFSFLIPSDGTIQTIITPVTIDAPNEGELGTGESDTLADAVGSAYILKRIVGKFFAQRNSTLTGAGEDNDNNPAVLLGAGFFVARANDASSGGGDNTPIGSATQQERNDNYSPLEADTIQEPWIWRRTWILGAAGKGAVGAIGALGALTPAFVTDQRTAAFPASTSLHGSVADGPHIDSRVKRIVMGDNRLWFAVSGVIWPFDATMTSGTFMSIFGHLDYRLFGALRKARNSSAF